MNFLLRLKLRTNIIEKSNEGIKHGSYDRVLQKRRRDNWVYLKEKKKVLLCPCKK
jgi:hypothetical protein